MDLKRDGSSYILYADHQGTCSPTTKPVRAGFQVVLDSRRFKVTVTIERYYTREPRDDLQRRDRGLAPGAVQQTESEWSQLIGMLELAQRWQELMREFTGEDAHPVRAGADDLRSASRYNDNSEGKKNARARARTSRARAARSTRPHRCCQASCSEGNGEHRDAA
jgi:hypothetical protein